MSVESKAAVDKVEHVHQTGWLQPGTEGEPERLVRHSHIGGDEPHLHAPSAECGALYGWAKRHG